MQNFKAVFSRVLFSANSLSLLLLVACFCAKIWVYAQDNSFSGYGYNLTELGRAGLTLKQGVLYHKGKVFGLLEWWNGLIENHNQRNNTEAFQQIMDGLNQTKDFSEEEKSSVFFHLFDQFRNQSTIVRLRDRSSKLIKNGFTPNATLKLIIHGYKMTGDSYFSRTIAQAYNEYDEDINVISSDWRELAGDSIYFNSAFNTRIAGERIGEFIVALKRRGLLASFNDVHIIGFSLGAHVAGHVGKHVMDEEKEKIGRITGLDPAGPCFSGKNATLRLDKEDAKFVDVIHTCIGNSGIMQSVGHVDFYPNGGFDQPGCLLEKIKSFFLRNCSHERAFYLYLDTIKRKNYVGCECSNWEDYKNGVCQCSMGSPGSALMGEHCSRRYIIQHEVTALRCKPNSK